MLNENDSLAKEIGRALAEPISMFGLANLTITEFLIMKLVEKKILSEADVRDLLRQLADDAKQRLERTPPDVDAQAVVALVKRLQREFFGTEEKGENAV
jgi:hypothetical protein